MEGSFSRKESLTSPCQGTEATQAYVKMTTQETHTQDPCHGEVENLANKAFATMVVKQINRTSKFGVVKTKGTIISDIIEKPVERLQNPIT